MLMDIRLGASDIRDNGARLQVGADFLQVLDIMFDGSA